MTAPIPISHSANALPHPNPVLSPPLPSNTPGSSMSISPQTPFFPNAGLATSSTPTQTSGLMKWASSFGKSPNTGGLGISPNKQSGFDVPPTIHDVEDHEHEHDSFEFGDYGDLKSRSWAAGGRRAMSLSYGAGAGAQSGIAAMLKSGTNGNVNAGAGVTDPRASPPKGGGTLPGVGHSMPAGGVMADKVAKGQGVLRRLSLTGSSYRPGFLSPTLQNTPLRTSPPATSAPVHAPSVPAPPPAEPQLNRAATVAGTTASRGRRYSEGQGQKKRGVSPMGERILRDQVHF